MRAILVRLKQLEVTRAAKTVMTSTEKYGGNEGVEGGGYEGEEGVGYDGELEPDYKYIALFT